MSDRRLRHADSAAFRDAMRALSSGVAIIAGGEGETRLGCTVTSLTSLSLAPPTLIVCLARSSSTLAGLREAGAFSVSLLAARHRALAHRFSGHSGVHGARRFDSAQWVTLSTGAPVLADAIAAFDCLVEEIDRTPLPRDRPRRRRKPQGGRRRTRPGAPARRVRAPDLGRGARVPAHRPRRTQISDSKR